MVEVPLVVLELVPDVGDSFQSNIWMGAYSGRRLLGVGHSIKTLGLKGLSTLYNRNLSQLKLKENIVLRFVSLSHEVLEGHTKI